MLQFSFCQLINVLAVVVIVGVSHVGDVKCQDFFRVSSNGDCVNPRGERGVCRNIGECKALFGLLIKSGSRPKASVIDFLRRSHCGFDGKDPIVCCPIEETIKADNRKHLNQVVNNQPSGENLEKSCGGIQVLDKIIGGNKATLYEFPWMALIGYKTRHGLQYRCGGTLISRRYVLTAAHCVSTLKDILPTTVRLGEYNLDTKEDCESGKGCAPPPKDYAIEEIIPHRNYFKPELRNDIALIRLAEKAEIKDSVRPICLPLKGNISERLLPEEQGVVTGWGTTETGIKSNVLLKTTLPIVSRNECSKSYETEVPITESQICAGGEAGKDSCSGDSGGPLQVSGVNPLGQPAYIQHGIVSFGSRNCGLQGKPGVYTKVAHYIDWILKNMKE